MKSTKSHFLPLLTPQNTGDVGTHSNQTSKHGALRGLGQWGHQGDGVGTKWGQLYV